MTMHYRMDARKAWQDQSTAQGKGMTKISMHKSPVHMENLIQGHLIILFMCFSVPHLQHSPAFKQVLSQTLVRQTDRENLAQQKYCTFSKNAHFSRRWLLHYMTLNYANVQCFTYCQQNIKPNVHIDRLNVSNLPVWKRTEGFQFASKLGSWWDYDRHRRSSVTGKGLRESQV